VTVAAEPLARADLAGATRQVLKIGHGIKPDVLLVELEGRAAEPGSPASVVVKDYAPRGPWVTRWLGPWLAAREQRIHRALGPLSAVPNWLGAIDELAFAIEFRPGDPLSRGLRAQRSAEQIEAFLERLDASVAAMHEHGVVHLDLRHRDNVLMDAVGDPVLIDFGAAMHFRCSSFWYRWYRPTVLVYDRRALAKWRERLHPGAPPSRRTLWRRLRSRLRRRRTPPARG